MKQIFCNCFTTELKFSFQSSLFLPCTLKGHFKGSGEGWAFKFWKDTLLLFRNNTYQNRPNKCDPHCLQPSAKPAALSHLCLSPSQLNHLTSRRTHPSHCINLFSLGKCKISVSQPVTDSASCRQQRGSQRSPQRWTRIMGKKIYTKGYKCYSSWWRDQSHYIFPSFWCCFSLWPWRNHLHFWCLAFGWKNNHVQQGTRKEGDAQLPTGSGNINSRVVTWIQSWAQISIVWNLRNQYYCMLEEEKENWGQEDTQNRACKQELDVLRKKVD